ncbi:unnamed protein product [Peniophora sp. CBMAI 1063]|nr:unnamed protein product [Peniophora sp. CBMAI 1063]
MSLLTPSSDPYFGMSQAAFSDTDLPLCVEVDLALRAVQQSNLSDEDVSRASGLLRSLVYRAMAATNYDQCARIYEDTAFAYRDILRGTFNAVQEALDALPVQTQAEQGGGGVGAGSNRRADESELVRKQLTALQGQMRQAYEESEGKRRSLNTQLAEADNNMQDMARRIENYQRERDASLAEKETLRKENNTLQEETESLKAGLEALRADRDSLQRDLEALRTSSVHNMMDDAFATVSGGTWANGIGDNGNLATAGFGSFESNGFGNVSDATNQPNWMELMGSMTNMPSMPTMTVSFPPGNAQQLSAVPPPVLPR